MGSWLNVYPCMTHLQAKVLYLYCASASGACVIRRCTVRTFSVHQTTSLIQVAPRTGKCCPAYLLKYPRGTLVKRKSVQGPLFIAMVDGYYVYLSRQAVTVPAGSWLVPTSGCRS